MSYFQSVRFVPAIQKVGMSVRLLDIWKVYQCSILLVRYVHTAQAIETMQKMPLNHIALDVLDVRWKLWLKATVCVGVCGYL